MPPTACARYPSNTGRSIAPQGTVYLGPRGGFYLQRESSQHVLTLCSSESASVRPVPMSLLVCCLNSIWPNQDPIRSRPFSPSHTFLLFSFLSDFELEKKKKKKKKTTHKMPSNSQSPSRLVSSSSCRGDPPTRPCLVRFLSLYIGVGHNSWRQTFTITFLVNNKE